MPHGPSFARGATRRRRSGTRRATRPLDIALAVHRVVHREGLPTRRRVAVHVHDGVCEAVSHLVGGVLAPDSEVASLLVIHDPSALRGVEAASLVKM